MKCIIHISYNTNSDYIDLLAIYILTTAYRDSKAAQHYSHVQIEQSEIAKYPRQIKSLPPYLLFYGQSRPHTRQLAFELTEHHQMCFLYRRSVHHARDL